MTSLDATFTIAYEDREQDPSVYWVPADGLREDQVNIDLATMASTSPMSSRARAIIELSFASDYSVTSLTGYKKFDFHYLEDYDGRPERVNDYRQVNDVEYWSQEFRINSPGDGPVTWFAGASVYGEEIDGYFEYIYDEDALCRALSITEAPDFSGPAAGCDDPNFEEYWGDETGRDIDPADILEDKAEASNVDVESEGWAVYGDFTWALSERFELTAGARYTYDQKKIRSRVLDSGGALGNNFNWEFFTDGYRQGRGRLERFHAAPRAKLRRQRRRHAVRHRSKGYKSGGFATFGYDLQGGDIDDDGLAPPGTTPLVFDPEAGRQLRDRREDCACSTTRSS